jgi:hypothetical protein
MWLLAGTFSISFSVFVLEVKSSKDFAKIPLLLGNVKETKLQSNEKHENDNNNNNNLPVLVKVCTC